MKNVLENLAVFIVGAILILIVVAFIVLEIYAWVKYGNKPVTEIPAWALALMFGGND